MPANGKHACEKYKIQKDNQLLYLRGLSMGQVYQYMFLNQKKNGVWNLTIRRHGLKLKLIILQRNYIIVEMQEQNFLIPVTE